VQSRCSRIRAGIVGRCRSVQKYRQLAHVDQRDIFGVVGEVNRSIETRTAALPGVYLEAVIGISIAAGPALLLEHADGQGIRPHMDLHAFLTL
jgi:hypothetical protein